MSRYMKPKSETETKLFYQTPTSCTGCPKINTESSSTSSESLPNDYLFSVIQRIGALEKDIQDIKESNKKTSSFFQSSAKLNDTIRVVVIILLLIPLIQLILCTCIVYHLGIEDELPNLLKWSLSWISILSIIEIIIGGLKIYMLDKRIELLEKK